MQTTIVIFTIKLNLIVFKLGCLFLIEKIPELKALSEVVKKIQQ